MTRLVHTVFGDAYRILFLSASVFAFLAIVLWAVWFRVEVSGRGPEWPLVIAPVHWHAHEMIFGYAGAVMGGFFLTALPNWTGGPPVGRGFLIAAFGFWLAGRVAIWSSGALGPVPVAIVDLAYLPLLGGLIAWQLVRRPKPSNVMLLGLFSLVWSGNLLTHAEWLGWIEDGVERGLRCGLLGVTALIAILGGRVIPAFTRNAMNRAGARQTSPKSRPVVEIAAIGSAVALPLCLALDLGPEPVGVAALTSGTLQALRLAGWKTRWACRQPILWCLHLGFAMLALGYLSLGLAQFDLASEVAALHILGIGAVGGMTIAIMSRAILGHSGRPLKATPLMVAAYGLVAVSALLRAVAGSLLSHESAVLGSVALWSMAFAAFILAVWKPVTTRVSNND